jgi:hypothetical protein
LKRKGSDASAVMSRTSSVKREELKDARSVSSSASLSRADSNIISFSILQEKKSHRAQSTVKPKLESRQS